MKKLYIGMMILIGASLLGIVAYSGNIADDMGILLAWQKDMLHSGRACYAAFVMKKWVLLLMGVVVSIGFLAVMLTGKGWKVLKGVFLICAASTVGLLLIIAISVIYNIAMTIMDFDLISGCYVLGTTGPVIAILVLALLYERTLYYYCKRRKGRKDQLIIMNIVLAGIYILLGISTGVQYIWPMGIFLLKAVGMILIVIYQCEDWNGL